MDFEARKVIEALRSGIPSRTIGAYFGGARIELLAEISQWLSDKTGGGKVLTASYGEGKTHLLNTVFNIAQRKNMAVSMLTLSKETPFSNLYQVYSKIAQNTYLPNREQPGFEHLIGRLNTSDMNALLLFAAKELQTDKLYYLLKAYGNTDNTDVQFSLLADLQGDFIAINQLKKVYREIFAEKVVLSNNFVKSKHIWDYFEFVNKLIALSGLNGWVILFDEAENIGRLGRKSRFSAYSNMAKFLNAEDNSIHSIFTMTNNYATQVIDGKDERRYLAESENTDKEAIEQVIGSIEAAEELIPLTEDEFMKVMTRIIDFHARAFEWTPIIDAGELCDTILSQGYYQHLRTKIRVTIEYLDQLYQFGDVSTITAGKLDQETYEEEIPLPDEL